MELKGVPQPTLVHGGCWELNSVPLQEQHVLITAVLSIWPSSHDVSQTSFKFSTLLLWNHRHAVHHWLGVGISVVVQVCSGQDLVINAHTCTISLCQQHARSFLPALLVHLMHDCELQSLPVLGSTTTFSPI